MSVDEFSSLSGELPARKPWTVSSKGALRRIGTDTTKDGLIESGWHQPETKIMFDKASIGFSYETESY